MRCGVLPVQAKVSMALPLAVEPCESSTHLAASPFICPGGELTRQVKLNAQEPS
jgi:hypothetical protein